MLGGGSKRPNRAEAELGRLLDILAPGEYRYVGDGGFLIGGKSPDFVNIAGRNTLVELFGDYWHRNDDPRIRAATFAPFGYRTLIIWEHELDEAMVDALLSAFHDGDL